MQKKKKSSWPKWAALLLVVAGAAGAVLYLRQPKAAAVEFRTETLSRGDLTQIVTANGNLSPVVDVEVGTQVSGIIKEIHVDFNSKVTNGQVIARIDPETFEANVMQSEAEVANTRASLELAQVNAKRAVELFKNRLISESEHDTTLASLHQAEAMLKIREAALKKARTDLERTTIYAPIDGIVISRNIEVGQTVASSFNTPKLFQIANDLSRMEIEAMVSEADVGGVEEKQPVTFLVDAFPSRQFRGTVRQVRYAPTTNQNVVTYTAVVEVENKDLKLRPGMTANASIITAQRRNSLRLPNAALRYRPPEESILKPPTNAPTAGSSTTNTSAAAPGEVPTPPWVAEGRQPNGFEEVRKWMETLTPEQRELARAQFGGRGRGGGGGESGGRDGRGAGSGASPRSEGPTTRTIYTAVTNTTPTGTAVVLAKPATVKLGITDGNYTEVLEGLAEGDTVIVGVKLPAGAPAATAQSQPASSPFGRQMGPPRGR